jgi:hypothetical protein
MLRPRGVDSGSSVVVPVTRTVMLLNLRFVRM